MRESLRASLPDGSLPDDKPGVLQAPLWSDVPLQVDRQRGNVRDWDPHHPGVEVRGRPHLRLLRHRRWLFSGGQLQGGDSVSQKTFSFSQNDNLTDNRLAWLDFGTNYCNLRNLVDGAG